MAAVGLEDGARIAVIGAGPAGAAFASSLLTAVRAFGRQAEVVLFDANASDRRALPVLLDLKTRCRLASLGAVITADNAPFALRGLIVHGAGRSAFIAPPNGGLWSLDTPARSGRDLVKRLLLDAAIARGATVRSATVESIEPMPLGEQRLRAIGRTETFQCVVGAFGVQSPLADEWLHGRYRAPPSRLAWHARVSCPHHHDAMMRLVLAPSPAIEAIAFIPLGHGRASLLVIGRDTSLEQLHAIEAIARLLRNGVLPSHLDLDSPGPTRVTLGAGITRSLFAPGQLTIGAAAHGHLVDPGLSPAISSATRSARLLFTLGESALFSDKLTLLQDDLTRHAALQPRFLRHARRAGPLAPDLLASLSDGRQPTKDGLSILGFGQLAALKTQRKLFWSGMRHALTRLFRGQKRMDPQPPPPRPIVYLLDDDPAQRDLLTTWLVGQGQRVRAFDSELCLLEVAAEQPPRAIILDVVLKWMDGLTVCRLLREHPATRDAVLIAISNLARQSDMEAAITSGADAFLPKPIDFARLAQLIKPLRDMSDDNGRETRQNSDESPDLAMEGDNLPEGFP